MPKRVVAFINTKEYRKPAKEDLTTLESEEIRVLAYHKPDILILDLNCSPEKAGALIDKWSQRLKIGDKK
ncbi:hypothetical protein D6825_03735 [Candidatus Woesearchaeota archaeon]|nr:MAG: hypothetical protein D6825_03735 [Candidatus Woesearchaeota archaeon]